MKIKHCPHQEEERVWLYCPCFPEYLDPESKMSSVFDFEGKNAETDRRNVFSQWYIELLR